MKELEFQNEEQSSPLKDLIVNYVGEKLSPEDNQVTLEHVLDVFIQEFPEMILAIAEENFIRGYKQAMQDIETPPEALVMSGGTFHGVQLWINLPKAKKRIEPAYQDLQGIDSATVSSADGGALIRVLAGELDGHRGPGISHTPLTIAHITVAPGARVEIPWRQDFNALAYVLAGNGKVGAQLQPIHMGQMAVLTDGDYVVLQADQVQDSKNLNLDVFLLGGVPLRETYFQYGPFVMSTKEEIIQAMEDFQKGRFGHIPPDAIMPHRM